MRASPLAGSRANEHTGEHTKMSAFTLVSSSTLDRLNTEYGFDSLVAAQKAQAVLVADLVAVGWTVDAFDNDCLWSGDNIVSFDIETEVDEENEGPFLSEYEQGWANIHNEQMADVMRQNREDAEYARQQAGVPSYMGVRGSIEPDGGVIYEP